jgi:hypothetical protein
VTQGVAAACEAKVVAGAALGLGVAKRALTAVGSHCTSSGLVSATTVPTTSNEQRRRLPEIAA